MNIPFFTPKTLGSMLVGLGSMGGGGGAVYLYQMPKNGKDLLIKEGYVFLSTDEDYKGMFNDQKDNEDTWKTEDDLREATDDDVKSKTQSYCTKNFEASLPSSSDPSYSTTKQKLISFCTTEGIKTVKARLIQSKQKNWIDEKNGDEKWKTIFAIYRYNEEFIGWLKNDNAANSNLGKTTSVDDGHSKLKDACRRLLAKNYADVKNEKEFSYGSGGCTSLDYATIKEKLKKDDSDGTEKPQSDTDGSDLVEKGKGNDEVKKWANKANSNEGTSELSEDLLKKLCGDSNLKSEFSDNDSYQEKYLVIKSVCKQESSST